MNKINGWIGYLILSIFLIFFAIAIGFSKGLPTWFQASGFTLFLVSSGIAARTSRELYKLKNKSK